MKRVTVIVLVVFAALASNGANEVREYLVNKVSGAPPVIDGEYTEAEWAGSQWTGDFYGLRHSANSKLRGQVIPDVWRWRALWDDDYLYVLISAELKFINRNGETWLGGVGAVNPLLADDEGYAGWNTGENLDFEVFLTPNAHEELGVFPNEVGGNPPGYQLAYFPLLADEEGGQVFADSNFGIRNKANGPPFFYTGTVGVQNIGPWNPIYDPAEAQAAGAKPFILAAQPHLIEGAQVGTDVVGIPVLEIAFPYSQFSFPALDDVTVIEDVEITLEHLIMLPDENGKYVNPGDEWLFNICGYTDGVVAEGGLTLITWNDMGDGGFHNAPRGKLIFTAGAGISSWMLH